VGAGDASSEPLADALLDAKRAREVLARALDRLTPDLREAFVLFELEELTAPEVAAIVGVPEGTVASRVRRARVEVRASFELQLLAASRAETPNDEAYKKALAATVAATTGAGAAGFFAQALANGSTKLAMKALFGLAAIGGIGVAVTLAHHSATPPPLNDEVQHEISQPLLVEPVSSIATAPVIATTVEPPAATSTAPRARVAVPSPPPSAQSSPLTREIEALDRARRALAASDTAGATRALDAYGREFPNGDMAPEATVMRVRVLLAENRADAARALADSFAAAHPSSPYTTRMLQLVSGKKE
jgi:hypothetical protein